MIGNKRRIRVDYAPLNIAVSVDCVTPFSPAMQVYNSSNGEYEPDRGLTPSLFTPIVIANTDDGSWTNKNANTLLTEMRWFVNGVEISTLPDWQGLYSINENKDIYRGTITIKRNIEPGTQIALHFEGVVSDMRLGTNIKVSTDAIVLATADKSEDAYGLSIGDDQIIQYNPFKDKLHLYNYKVAHDIITPSKKVEMSCIDENAYIRNIGVTLFKSDKVMTSGYTLKLYRVETSGILSELSAGTDEVVDITPQSIVLDLRLVTKSDYVIKAIIPNTNRIEPQIQFSVNRVFPAFTCIPTNGTSINPTDKIRRDKAMVDSEGLIVECPASILKILWYTDSATIQRKQHNEGEDTAFVISETGIGDNYENDWLDIYTDTEIKQQYNIATDENGDIFTDENGNRLIFN